MSERANQDKKKRKEMSLTLWIQTHKMFLYDREFSDIINLQRIFFL